jgi:hypothetical protein
MKRWGFTGFVLVAAVAGVVAVVFPDIKRYLRIREM